MLSFLSCRRARRLSRDIPAHTGFLCDNIAVLGAVTDETLFVSKYVSKYTYTRLEQSYIVKKKATLLYNYKHVLMPKKLQSTSQIWRMRFGESHG
jgi:hypothetical protein